MNLSPRLGAIVRWILVVCLLLACGFDIYTTISNPNFLSLESNTFLSIKFLVAFKIAFCVALSIVLLRLKPDSRSFTQYFYIHFILLLIFAQGMAGFNNISAKEQVMATINAYEGTNYTEFSQVPTETIKENFALPEASARKAYLTVILSLFYVPLGLGLLSFVCWQMIFHPETAKIPKKDK